VLRKLIDAIDVSKLSRSLKPKDVAATNKDLLPSKKDVSSVITHEWLWPTVGSFFRPKDVIITETGKIPQKSSKWQVHQILGFSIADFQKT
jgi:TPP-dependent 2-oxoacid decarboxylase